ELAATDRASRRGNAEPIVEWNRVAAEDERTWQRGMCHRQIADETTNVMCGKVQLENPGAVRRAVGLPGNECGPGLHGEVNLRVDQRTRRVNHRCEVTHERNVRPQANHRRIA